MAHAARIAYFDGKTAKTLYKNLGYTRHKFFEKDGAQAHAVWNSDEYVLCFRGTEPSEFSDIKADLNAWPDRAQIGGRVHNGFQNEVEKLWPGVLKHLEANSKNKNIYLTGHSLGGAMATVAASRLNDRVSALYTYGSPRVGNREFVKQFKHLPHYRHVNNNDVVVKVPFAILGYIHHCSPRYMNYYGQIRTMTPWQRFKDKLRGRWRALQKRQVFDGFYDHSADEYCKNLEQDQ